MHINEIGSEFWFEGSVEETDQNLLNNCIALLSGRSALDFVCRDSKIQSITLPSYCCSTMIEPFLRNGVEVFFYEVNITEIDCTDDCRSDAILVIDYFGYWNPLMHEVAKRAKERGQIVVYDSTHHLLENNVICQYATYSIISYRKWMYCNYAVVKKYGSPFSIAAPESSNDEYISLRNKAAKMKANYIINGSGDKYEFLSLFTQANVSLQGNYEDCIGKPIKIYRNEIIKKRKENAAVLIEGISRIENINLWFFNLHASDTPLFVPILVKDEVERKALQEFLASANIYCPIHWPQTEYTQLSRSSLYQRELSLICDQRYGKEEMLKQIKVVSDFYNR